MQILFPDNFPTESEMITYIKKIILKSWKTNINEQKIQKWLANFTGQVFDIDDEKKLALWLLCNYTFYNEEEISHLCSVLSNLFLHALITNSFSSSQKISKSEIDEILSKTIFTQIGKPGESGGMILYYFRQEARLSIQNFAQLDSIDFNKYDNIVCIDDSILSGNTAKTFFQQKLQNKIKQNNHIYFLSLFSTQEALDNLKPLGIELIYSILLDKRSQYFSDESMCFSMFPSLLQYGKIMAEEYGKSLIDDKYEKPLGYNNGQYNFSMFYNSPNNTLPIFWSNKNNWYPLFLRKEKIYFDDKSKRDYNNFI